MVSLRRSRALVGRPIGGRRGRSQDVPLSVYYELDDIRRELTGLRAIVGVNRESVFGILQGLPEGEETAEPLPNTPSPENPPTVLQEQATDWAMFTQANFAQKAKSRIAKIPLAFRMDGFDISVEVFDSGLRNYPLTTGTPRLFIGGTNRLNASQVTVSDGDLLQFTGLQLLNNAGPTFWAANSPVQLGFDRIAGEDNTKVSGVLHMTVKMPF